MRRFGVTATLMPSDRHPPQGYLVDAETAEAAVEIVKSRVRDFQRGDVVLRPLRGVAGVFRHHTHRWAYEVTSAPAQKAGRIVAPADSGCEWETETTWSYPDPSRRRHPLNEQQEPERPDGEGWEPFAGGAADGALFTRWRRVRVWEPGRCAGGERAARTMASVKP